MKSKTILAVAVAGLFWSMGASADPTMGTSNEPTIGSQLPMNVSEVPASMTTITSLDTKTGGFRGWGPMANPQTPASVSESYQMSALQDEQHYKEQLAEVHQIRDQVWVANAPMRAEYENIGATRSHAGGFGSFFHRDTK